MKNTWITDSEGNRCSVEYFGSVEAAQQALDSLTDCINCTNCSYCFRCSTCTDCTNCSRCFYCFDCSYCSCSVRCSYCSDCFSCSYCSDCVNCTNCFYCFDCSYSSNCYRCSYGSDSSKNNSPHAPTIPTIPDIHKAVYAAASNPNSLKMKNVHTCKNTHCRAGWVITLAGEVGKKLEKFYNWELAAMLIYRKSGYKINPARFYDSNEDALADMKRLAEV